MKTPEGITVIPVTPQEIAALLNSDELSAVESAIAERCEFEVLRELDSATTSDVQSEVSVGGMTVAQILSFLATHKSQLIEFGVRFLADDAATDEEQEFPVGEEQDPDDEDEDSETIGYAVGFGVKYAIYYNFLANRPAAELRAFLKNRRIPQHTKFAKELARVFAERRG